METHIKEKAKEGEIVIYKEVLDKIADIYNPTFLRLILPKAITFDEAGQENLKIIQPKYEKAEGRDYNKLWNTVGEEEGGVRLDPHDLPRDLPELLSELAQINTEIVLKSERLQRIPKLRFKTSEYMHDFERATKQFHADMLLSEEEIVKASVIVGNEFTSKLVLNNADFYPRNFIRQPDTKIVLVDWDPWEDRLDRACKYTLDHLENIAAHCYVHMWNNPAWQENYIVALRKKFPAMTREDFQRALLINSLGMALWFGIKEEIHLRKKLLGIFKAALNEETMHILWGGP